MPRGGIETHAEDCCCGPCRNSRRNTEPTRSRGVRLPASLWEWVDRRGGVAWLREVLEQMQEASA